MRADPDVVTELLQAVDPVRFLEARLGIQPDAKQRELLRRRRKRVLLNCTRQWGKSTMAAALAVHRGYFRPESLTLALSPSARQSGEFVRKAAGFLRKLGIKPRGDGDNAMSLVFPNGSRIVGLPGVDDTARGFSAPSLVLIDEAARVGDRIYRMLRPMLAASNGDLWLMSTPNGKQGFFWEAWWKQERLWERVSVPATECPRIAASFLEEEREALGDRHFRQEYLCEFTETDEALFCLETIERAFTQEVKALKL